MRVVEGRTPHRVRELKFRIPISELLPDNCRTPHRVRELKYWTGQRWVRNVQSHPSQGAGVEIVQCPRCRNYFLESHPTWGAGVEIIDLTAWLLGLESHSSQGAGVEMMA